MESRKVLISSDFGAGWSTWSHDGKNQAVAEYKPIIEFLENGGNRNDLDDEHPLIVKMISDLKLDYFYTGGACDLVVETVTPPYRINEYDGAESIVEIASDETIWR